MKHFGWAIGLVMGILAGSAGAVGHLGDPGFVLEPGDGARALSLGTAGRADPGVAHVFPGSPADRAGLLAGDVLVAVDGREFGTGSGSWEALAGRQPGDQVVLSLLRRGSAATVTLVIGPVPPPSPAVEALRDWASDRETSLARLRQLAGTGDVEAQFSLAWLLSRQVIKPARLESAFQWYVRAAEQGYAPAQHAVGSCFFHGQGVARDVNQAAQWLRKAAGQEHAGAAALLARIMDSEGDFVGDRQEAVTWFEKAAWQGVAEAQYALALAFAFGNGVAQDKVAALAWEAIARQSGEPPDDRGQELLPKVLPMIRATMTPEEIEAATKRAAGFREKRNWRPYSLFVDTLHALLEPGR